MPIPSARVAGLQALQEEMRRRANLVLTPAPGAAYRVRLANPDELWQWVADVLNLRIPRKRVCRNHSAPFDAFQEAYFAEEPVTVWWASRGLGGKSALLAALSLTESITLGSAVTLLGGSGEQSQRVKDYMTASPDSPLPHSYWGAEKAPKQLLGDKDFTRRTILTNGGSVLALAASTKSARGPHPPRVRLDEVDEMSQEIFEAALGQAMDQVDHLTGRVVRAQTVCSSTWQYPKGTMTYVLEQAREKRWPVHEWCYRENVGWWLTEEALERKRRSVPSRTWEVEFELQEPNSEGRLVPAEIIAKTFDKHLGEYNGEPGREVVLAQPVRGARYATGGDWARDVDWTSISTYRIDVPKPHPLVAWARYGRVPYPQMIAAFNARVRSYPGPAAYDVTGLGKVIEDYVEVDATPVDLVGKTRADVFSTYLLALEHGEVVHPHIQYMRAEHSYVSARDLYSSAGHPPDTFVSNALARWATKLGSGVRTNLTLRSMSRREEET